MLLLLWPARPHTLLSCRVRDTSTDGALWYFKPMEHKRKPTDAVFAVRFPENWHSVFASFVSKSNGLEYLFSVDGTTTDDVVRDAFSQFL